MLLRHTDSSLPPIVLLLMMIAAAITFKRATIIAIRYMLAILLIAQLFFSEDIGLHIIARLPPEARH